MRFPAGCIELVQNGGFELDADWRFGNSRFRARRVNEPTYAGEYSLRLGVPSESANRFSHSSALQTVVLPEDAVQITLSYWELSEGKSDGGDYREVLLLDSDLELLTPLSIERTAGDGSWVERNLDISTYRGNTVNLYFNIFNDGTDTKLWSYLDNVSLIACNTLSE